MMRRELVSSGEITDVLLDVRTLLTMPAKVPATAADRRLSGRLVRPPRQAASRSLNARSRQRRSSSGSVTASVSMFTPMSRLWL